MSIELFTLQILGMKTIKIELTADEAKMLLACLEKQKRKHVEIAEKEMKSKTRPPYWCEVLKTIHLQHAKYLQNVREKILFEMFKKRIK